MTKLPSVLSLVVLAIYGTVIPIFLLRSPPTRESLLRFEVSPSHISVEGTEPYLLKIVAQPDQQIRYTRLQKETLDWLSQTLATGKHTVIVQAAPNPVYVGHLWGGPREDLTLYELQIDGQVVIAYADSVSSFQQTRLQAGFIAAVVLAFLVYQLGPKIRAAFAPSPFVAKRG